MSDRTAENLLRECSILIFDFDGVILDSNQIKEEGFRRLFLPYGQDKAEKMVAYHRANGGMSRYEKIEYFFNSVMGRPIEAAMVDEFAEEFSKITMSLLKDPALQIKDTIAYIDAVGVSKEVYIASAAEQNDLSELCYWHGIADLFNGIFGSPRTKIDIVGDIIKGREKERCVLIGDSTNDLKAARANKIAFIGYNNPELDMELPYIDRFSDLMVCND